MIPFVSHPNPPRRRRLLAAAAGLALLAAGGIAVARRDTPRRLTPGADPVTGAVRLHNGWKITPAGTHETTSDMLVGSALSPDGLTLATVSAGYGSHDLNLVDTKTGKVTQRIGLLQAWNGVAWAADGKTIYVSGGASPNIHTVTQGADGKWAAGDNIAFEPGAGRAYVSGVAVSRDGATLYAANIASDTLMTFHLPDGKPAATRTLGNGERPYCVRVGPDGLLYVTAWAAGQVLVLDGASLATVRTITTGSHPNDLAWSRDGKRLFVSCGNDDMVYAVNPTDGATRERIRMTVTPKAPAGATPCALSVSPDGKTLYVANSDNNDVAVVDISRDGQSRVKGFIPTGWYPTTVCAAPDGKTVFIGSGKGMGTGPNPSRPVKPDDQAVQIKTYIGRMLGGLVSTVPAPDAARLAAYSRQVVANSPYTGDTLGERPNVAPRPGTNAVPGRVGDASPIKYVLYIIKENRTYDQVFGDFTDASGKPAGNGDKSLTLFGEDITPNQHALARQFVLLDNVYCDGEVSADGHPWSDGAYANDFTQRTWPVSYSGKGQPPANPAITLPPAGYLWDRCKQKGLGYRSYGELTFAVGPDAPPTELGDSDGATALKGHASQAWQRIRANGRDTDKAEVFIRELHDFEKNKTLPNFMIMSLGENHTQGTRRGAHTPKACVASNDLAVGKIVEACSKSPYWPQMAIFIIEDDAQNGPDHVDAHRTPALVISPYTKRGAIDGTFYTTTSLLRTMELILGLAPLSQYDAAATPMYASFTARPDVTGFTALPARTNLNAVNGQTAWGAGRMARIDFSDYDHLTVADEDALNRALWHSVKGTNVAYPAPVRAAWGR